MFSLKIKYYDDLGWRGGCFKSRVMFPLICIKNKYKDDRGLLEHELTHYRQWKNDPFFYDLKYQLSKERRLMYEIEAYAKQYQVYCNESFHNPDYSWIIDSIYNKYSLGKSREEIKTRFEEYLRKMGLIS